MKKIITLSLFFVLCVMDKIDAQLIEIKIDSSCTPSLYVNKQLANPGQAYQLDIDNINNLRILLINEAPANKCTVTIPLQNKRGLFDPDLQGLFKTINPITANDLVNTFKGKVTMANLLLPFRIMVVCRSDRNTALFWDFDPNPVFPVTLALAKTESSNTQNQPIQNQPSNKAFQDAVYQPGSAVYDALKLADGPNLSQDELKRIVQFYYPKGDINDTTKAMDSLRSNPFIKSVLPVPQKQSVIGKSQDGKSLLSSLSLSSIGGLDVTNIVDGLAKFLVKRAKEELNTAFFEKFKEELDKYPDLKTLFPKTVNLLGSIGTEVYNYQKYIQNLREAFKDDIETLYKNLPGIIDNHREFFSRHQELAASLRSGCYLVGALQQQVHPGDILANYPTEYLDSVNGNWLGSVQTLQLLSASMRETQENDQNYWVNIKYLRQLVNTKNAFMIYLGLVYQMAKIQYNTVPFANGSLVDVLEKIAPRIATINDTANKIYNAYKTYVLRFGEKTSALNDMIANYIKPANDSLALELYKKYFDASQDLIEYAAQVGQLPILNRVKFISNLDSLLQPYFKVTNLTSNLIVEINRKNYSAAVNDAILIYDFVRNKPAKVELDLATAKADTTAMDYKKALASSNATDIALAKTTDSIQKATQTVLASTANKVSSTLRNLAKYGAFMSTVATAKTSDEVAAAIEAFVLPAGSARIKRQSNFNVALNAYVGLYGGAEYLPSLKKNATAFSAGLTAPIGIAISWGKKGCGKSEEALASLNTGKAKGSSYTIFASLIDIGAAAAFRFGDTTSSITSTIQLKNIIAPGLYFYYGFRNSPFSLGLGAQVGPQLRKISSNDINIGKEIYLRFGLSFAVDLPLLNFYTKNK